MVSTYATHGNLLCGLWKNVDSLAGFLVMGFTIRRVRTVFFRESWFHFTQLLCSSTFPLHRTACNRRYSPGKPYCSWLSVRLFSHLFILWQRPLLGPCLFPPLLAPSGGLWAPTQAYICLLVLCSTLNREIILSSITSAMNLRVYRTTWRHMQKKMTLFMWICIFN
jgi:hypothetical protein